MLKILLKTVEKCYSKLRFKAVVKKPVQLFHHQGLYQIEASPLISRANQWTGFYMIGTSVMKELIIQMK